MKKKKFEKLDFAVLDPGDKLIIQTPKTIQMVDRVRLIDMSRKFLTDPYENVMVVPEGFVFFLLKEGSDLEVRVKNGQRQEEKNNKRV